MAEVTRQQLGVLAYANGFTLWHYASADTVTTISAAGYFDSLAGQLRVGDVIIATLDTGTAPETRLLAITDNTAGAITIATVL